MYDVVVEEHTADRCWTYEDAVCGLFGWSCTYQRAADLLTEYAVARTPAA